MALWNFAHTNVHTHVYILLAIVLLAAIIIIAFAHTIGQKKRDHDNEDELRKLKTEFGPEPSQEDKAPVIKTEEVKGV